MELATKCKSRGHNQTKRKRWACLTSESMVLQALRDIFFRGQLFLSLEIGAKKKKLEVVIILSFS